MQKRKLAKPQTDETVENVDVYACETNGYCQTNSGSCGFGCPCPNTYICGGKCGDNCPDLINSNYCGDRCGS